MKSAFLIFAAVLSVTEPPAAETPSADAIESVTYNVPFAMGETFHWRVDRDGTGEIMQIVDDPDRHHSEWRWQDLRLRPETREQFIALMNEVSHMAGQLPPCDRIVIDGVLGSIVWTGPSGTRTLVFSAGCMGPEYEAVHAKVLEANFLVERRAIIYREPTKIERF